MKNTKRKISSLFVMVCILINICIPFAEAAPIDMTFNEAINDTFEGETETILDDVSVDAETEVKLEVSAEGQTVTDDTVENATRVIVLYNDSNGNKIESDNITAISDDIDVITLEKDTDIAAYIEDAISSNDNIKLIQRDYELKLAGVSDNWSFHSDTERKAEFVKKEKYDTADINDYKYKKTYRIDSRFDDATKNNSGAGVTIAILDTAVNAENSEGSMSHGTAINNLIAGIVPEAQIISYDIFREGKAYVSDVVKAILECEQKNVSIVNCSWTVDKDSSILDEVIKNSNMLFVCASGNEGENLDEHPTYPAAYEYDNVISVGAINADGEMCEYSNYSNTKLDITAQGSNIIGTDDDTEYDGEGTSFSAAFVSAAAAIVYSYSEEISSHEVKNRLLDGADCLSTLYENVQDGRFLNSVNALDGEQSTDIIVLQDKENEVVEVNDKKFSLFNNSADEFNEHSSMIEKRNKFKSVTVDGTIYVLGGYNENGMLNTAEKYNTADPEAGWQSVANMPNKKLGFAATADNSKIYVVGGFADGQSTSDFQIYDIASNTWSSGPAMPQARERCAATICMGKLYVIGGRNNDGYCTNALVYDFNSETWTYYSGFSNALLEPIVSSVNDAIYVIGGFSSSGSWQSQSYRVIPQENSLSGSQMKYSPKTFIDTNMVVKGDCQYLTCCDDTTTYIYKYDTLLKKWSVDEAGLLPKYMYYQIAMCNNDLYLIGGYNEDYSDLVYKKSIVSDTVNTDWNFHSNLDMALNQTKMFLINGEKYIVGGFNRGPAYSMYKFNESRKYWNREAYNHYNISLGSAKEYVNNCIYIIGGYNTGSSSFYKNVYVYNLDTKKWTTGASMTKERERMGSIVYGDYIYVFGGRNRTGAISDIDIYNTKTDTWKSGGSLPQPMMNMAVGIYGHNIVLAGGYDAQGTPLNKYYIYDAETKKVIDSGESTLISENITKVDGINNLMFACKGFGNRNVDFIQYDYENNAWSKCELNAILPNFDYVSYASDGDRIFAIGGYSIEGNENSDIVLSTEYQVSEVEIDTPSKTDETYSSTEVTIEKGKSYILALTSANFSEIKNKTIQLSYDKNVLTMTDACAQTWNNDLKVGIVQDTDIEIKKISDSMLQFKINKEQDYITGTLNLIKFEAKANCKTNLSVYAID